jgi:hypothetical protein
VIAEGLKLRQSSDGFRKKSQIAFHWPPAETKWSRRSPAALRVLQRPLLFPEDIQIKPYSGRDERIGWESTYIVTLNGEAVGFLDGDLPEKV